MPLSVPLVLAPGEPGRHYTVHLHRARWDVDMFSAGITAGHLSALETNVRKALRLVSECVAAELAHADVESVKNADGSAEAVARVLCTEEVCAAVAERYLRDADEDVEAESARTWAATKLPDHTVELFKPIVLMRDEVTELLQLPEETSRTLDQITQQDRASLSIGPLPEGEVIMGQMRGGKTFPPGVALQAAQDVLLHRAHLDLPNPYYMTPVHLVREAESLALNVAAGHSRSVGVKRLAELCKELARRHDAEPQPRPCPGRCREDDDPFHDLVHRIGFRPCAVPAGEVRAANVVPGPDVPLRVLPKTPPADDQALVLVYRKDTPGLGLLDAVLSGSEDAVRGAADGTLMWLNQDGK
ncbi:hypothetical protein [Streptomyces sp. NPDC055607]